MSVENQDREFPMFDASSGFVKKLIEAVIHKIIGTEVNAKINAKSKK